MAHAPPLPWKWYGSRLTLIARDQDRGPCIQRASPLACLGKETGDVRPARRTFLRSLSALMKPQASVVAISIRRSSRYDSSARRSSSASSIVARSEEHTSELQSRGHLVCRLLLEKKNRILK